MICPKCHYEFCWTCMGHYPSYMHDEGMKTYHNIAGFFKAAIPILLFLFVVVKLLYISNPTFSFKNTERVLDTLTKGQSIFTSYHILVTFLAWITIHLYLLITTIFGFTMSYRIKQKLERMGLNKKLVYLYEISYIAVVLLAFSHVKFGCLSLQIFFFEVCLILFIPVSLVAGIGVFAAGIALIGAKFGWHMNLLVWDHMF